MNKHQEALDKLRTHCLASPTHAMGEEFGFGADYDLNHDGYEDETDVLQELVDKATPKRVVGLSITYDGLVGNCPSCKKFVRQQDSKPNLCECTQQMDWSQDDNPNR